MPTISITISEDLDTGLFTLEATSFSRTEPAGPRLFRAEPHPAIAFEHRERLDAESAARELREYLAGIEKKRGPSKAKLRKQGAT